MHTDRRTFLKRASSAVAAAMTLPIAMKAAPPKYKMGLQLFTVRDAMARDVKGTLERIAALGYQDLETYGYTPVGVKYYGLPAADFKRTLEDYGLTTSSGHYDLFRFLNSPLDDLLRYVDQCVQGAHALGQRYITWPWLDPDSRTLDKFKLLAERLNVVGERVNKGRLGFAYHNHDFEFIDHGGQNGYDIIMKETDPSLVKLQVDLYWVAHSSKRPALELFDKQPGRFVMWHVKDMDKVTRDYTELGNGSIDYTKILPHASRSGMEYYFIEQGGNFAKDSMQSIADSAAFFKKHLERHLG